MKFKNFLDEETVEQPGPMVDVVDTGKKGKEFERKFMQALKMMKLDFDENHYAGRMWDFKPKGKGWEKIISDKPVNVKVAGTKWMFGTSALYKMLPWEKLPEDFDADKAAAKVKRFLNKKGLKDIVYMKPLDKDIEKRIKKAVDNKDIEGLKKIFIKKNFQVAKLGTTYKVRVLKNKERVTSVAIDHGGKVFMRSEKPRNMKGTMMVNFRTPKPQLTKAKHKPVIKESRLEKEFMQEIVDILDTSPSLAVAKLDIVAMSDDYIQKGLPLRAQVKMLEMLNKLKGILK
jgi:hypothetical protein